MTRQKEKTATTHLAHLQVAPSDPRPKLAKELNLACPPASLKVLCFILTFIFFVDTLTAQINKVIEPEFKTFKQTDINPYYNNSNLIQQNQQVPIQNYPKVLTAQDIINQTNSSVQGPVYQFGSTPEENQRVTEKWIDEQMRNDPAYQNPNNFSNKRLTQHQELLNIINEANSAETGKRMNFEYYKSADFADKTKPYTYALNLLKKMATGEKSISLRDAFYITENAYGNTYLSYKEYCNIIKDNTDFMKQMMIQNGLDPHDNEAIHKTIQKFGKDTTSINLPKNEMTKITTKKHIPYTYDYIDYKGEKDFRNYFVTKAFSTGTGQCSSLPVVYGILAESLGATFYLSTAPNHSFIKYPDNAGKIHNLSSR